MTKNKKKNINKLYKTSDSSLIFIVHAKVGLMLTCSLNKLHCHLMVISSKWESEDEKFIQQPAQSGVCKRKTAGGWGCVTLTPRQCSPLRLVKSPECSLHQATHTHTHKDPLLKLLIDIRHLDVISVTSLDVKQQNLKSMNWQMTIFTFGSPSDDSQPTSDGKREHPLLSSCRSAAFPHRVRLRDGEGEMLGSQAPLPKHDPRWHVHFLTRDEKTTAYVLLLTLSPSRRPCCLLLALVFTCSPPTLENIQSSQVSLSKKRRKQVQALFFF